jgi:ferredoxin-NADP reductase
MTVTLSAVGDTATIRTVNREDVVVTRVMSMIRTLANRGDKRPVILMYGSKDWESITFREELEALEARHRP